MKKLITIFGLASIMSSPVILAQATNPFGDPAEDEWSCNAFLGRSGAGDSHRSHGFSGDSWGSGTHFHVPFKLKDGKIVADKDAKVKVDDSNPNEVVTEIKYKIPDPIAHHLLAGDSAFEGNPYTNRLREVSVKVKQDAKGNLMRIRFDRNLSQKELLKIYDVVSKDMSVPPAFPSPPNDGDIRTRVMQLLDEKNPVAVMTESQIEFAPGKPCLPRAKFDVFTDMATQDGTPAIDQRSEIAWHADACESLHNALKDNHAAKSCIDADSKLNRELDHALSMLTATGLHRHKPVEINHDVQRAEGYDVFNRPTFSPFTDAINRGVNTNRRILSDRNSLEASRRAAFPPVAAAQMALQECYDSGLGNYLHNGSYSKPQKPVTPQGGTSGASER